MGRSSAISIAATAAIGSYAAQTFVPGFAGRGADAVQLPSLRGAAPSSPSAPTSAVLAVGGVVGLAATVSATRRPATATKEMPATATKEMEEPPPQFDPSKQVGASAPLGFFDPLNFSKVGDQEGFRKLRVAELKHGRVAMMASVGAVVQHYVQFPGFQKVPKGILAITDSTGIGGFAALIAASAVLELFLWTEDETKPVVAVGGYGNPAQLGGGKPLGLSVEMKARELENGRAAMIAISGIVVAELLTGKDGIQQLGW